METSSKPRRRRIWPWVVAGCLAPCLLLAVVAWSIVTPMRELANLRDKIVTKETGDWETQVQLDLGPGSLALVRMILRFVEHEEIDKARLALAAVRRASVGVYSRTSRTDRPVGDLLAAAQLTLESRGWTKVAKIVESDSLVLVYHLETKGAGEFCVAVVDDDECVLVYAKLAEDELAELVKLASSSAPELQRF